MRNCERRAIFSTTGFGSNNNNDEKYLTGFTRRFAALRERDGEIGLQSQKTMAMTAYLAAWYSVGYSHQCKVSPSSGGRVCIGLTSTCLGGPGALLRGWLRGLPHGQHR